MKILLSIFKEDRGISLYICVLNINLVSANISVTDSLDLVGGNLQPSCIDAAGGHSSPRHLRPSDTIATIGQCRPRLTIDILNTPGGGGGCRSKRGNSNADSLSGKSARKVREQK